MTLSASARRAGPYNGNGSTTSFPFTFKVFTTADIQVTLEDSAGVLSTLVLDHDYSVTLNLDQTASPGGTITYPITGSPMATGYSLAITGDIAYDQQTSLPAGGKFSPTVIENTMDRTTIQIQQLLELSNRQLSLPATIDPGTVDVMLPSPEASKVLGWDGTGSSLVNIDATSLASVVASAYTVVDKFTGTGSLSAFGLSQAVATTNMVEVTISGVVQNPGVDYTIAGKTLTFASAPGAGLVIIARYIVAASQTTDKAFLTEVQTATAGQTAFSLVNAYTPGSNTISVYVNGLLMRPVVDYLETSTNVVTFTSGLTAGNKVTFQTWLANAVAGTISAANVNYSPAGTGAVITNVQTKLRAIDSNIGTESNLTDLSQDPVLFAQDLRYLKDSIGLGYSNGDVHINGNLNLGGVRNLLSTTNDLSLITPVNATKDTTKSIKFRNITLQRAYGSNFYSSLNSNLSGTSVVLTAGKKYLASCYVINLSDQEKFLWQRSLGTGSDYGHGAKLVDRNVRRIWDLVKATTTSKVDLMPDPTVALGSGPNNDPYWIALNRGGESFDVRIGGFMLEQVPDDAKMGVAVIGDSTVAGSSGKKDLAASTEWTRWAEAQLNVPFFNRGVGGETTANMRSRWTTDMTPLAVNANYAIIQGGINDIVQGRTLTDIQTDIQWMHDQSITDGMQPIICTCTPTATISATSAYETIRQSLNTWIKQNFALILDLDKVVRDPMNNSLLRQKAGWVGDGTHFDTTAKRAIGICVASWPYWDFIKPSPYQERTGNASIVDPVRAGTLYHMGSGYAVLDVSGTGSLNLKNDTRLNAQVLELSGALTGARTVYIQGFIPKLWLIRNNTSGAFALAVNGVDSSFSAIGSGVTIGQGKAAWILSTGTGLIRGSADV